MDRNNGSLRKITGCLTSERNEKAIANSREIISKRFRRLKDELVDQAKNDSAKKPSNYKYGFEGLHSMCRLLMDEITFTTKRLDDLEGVKRVQRAFILATIALLATCANLAKERWSSQHKTSNDHPFKIEDSTEFQALVARFEAFAEFQRHEKPPSANPGELTESILSLTKSINAHSDRLDGVAGDTREIHVSIDDIAESIKNLKVPTAEIDVHEVRSDLGGIKDSLVQIASTLDNQKPPIVNVTPRIEIKAPSQTLPPPDKKAFGLINIDASKVGTSDTEKPDQSQKSRPRLNPPHK